MGVIKCNLPSLMLNYISTKDIDLEYVMIQNYLNTLECNLKEIICIDKYNTDCKSIIENPCDIYIKNIEQTLNSVTIDLNKTVGVNYTWSVVDTDKITLIGVPGLNTINYNWIDTSNLTTAGVSIFSKIKVDIESATGCKLTRFIDVCYSLPYDNITYTVTLSEDNICSEDNIKNIGGIEYYEVDVNVTLNQNGTSIKNLINNLYLKVEGSNDVYLNGFTLENNTFKLRIKTTDKSLLQNKNLIFIVELPGCNSFLLNYELQFNNINCCLECNNTEVFINNDQCVNYVYRNGTIFSKYTIDLSLKCGSIDLKDFINMVEFINDINVDYFLESINNYTYNLFVKTSQVPTYCSQLNVNKITLRGVPGTGSSINSLINGRDYMSYFINVSDITNEEYDPITDTYKFLVPPSSTLYSSTYHFCSTYTPNMIAGEALEFIDLDGLITVIDTQKAFATNSRNNFFGGDMDFIGIDNFQGSTGNNTFQNVQVKANGFFSASTGNNTFIDVSTGTIALGYTGTGFGLLSTGDFTFNNLDLASSGFGVSTGNITISTLHLQGNCFVGSSSNIDIIELNSSIGIDSFDSYTGTLTVHGKLGVSVSSTPEFTTPIFVNTASAILNVRQNLNPIILGYTEGDIALFGGTVNYIL